MSPWTAGPVVALTVLAGLVALVWVSRHYLIWRERRNESGLSASYPGPPDGAPPIHVFVAAKDEADNIETCVRSMLEQDYPRFSMTVCNDRSTDATGEIVERIASEDPRVNLVNIESLPEGWCGKNNAMQTGICSTDSEWICMIDADCRQTSTRTLSVAMQYATDTNADLLSVLPELDMRGFWEYAVQPVCGGVMMIWFRPDRVNDPNDSSAYANGAFMLMKRSAYEAIGKHERVKGEVNEDMHMADLVKKAGMNLRVVRGDGLYRVRMYTSLKSIVRGWARIFFGTFGTLKRLTLSFALMTVMGLLPYAAAILGLSMALSGAQGASLWWALGIAGAAGVLIQISVIFRFYKLLGAKPLLAWSYPLGCVVVLLSLSIALSKLRRGAKVTWRGTSYSAAK